MAINDAYPLTRLQSGMLYHSHLDTTGTTYHDLSSLKISGPFDASRLRSVLAALLAGHDILRSGVELTRFSEPMQLVHDHVEPPLTVEDLTGLTAVGQDAHITSWRAAEKARPFDLATPPLLRVHAQLVGDTSFWLNLSFHHAILDGWSLSLLTSWLLTEYDRSLAGHTPRPPRLASRFRDLVRLEREALADGTSRDYWRDLLADTEVLELPRWGDTGRTPAIEEGAERSARVHRVAFRPELTEQLKGFAAGAKVATKAALYAAHAGVLSRMSGRQRVITGRVANCRPESPDADRMIGLFLNSVPLVLDTGRTSWRDLARQVHHAEVEALAHRRYPLGQMQRDLNRDSLFETLVDYRAMRSYGGLSLTHLTIEDTNFFEQTNFPFTANFGADPNTGEIGLGINYDEAEFPAEQIEAIGGYYAAALEAMVDDPAAPVSAAPLLSTAETTRQLKEWNDTAAEFPLDRPLPSLLAEAAERYPDKVALTCGDREVTYAGLYQRVNRLAWQLRERGVGPDVVVGVSMRRSVDLITAVLAVLWAGGAYLPLDPDYPADRLAYMLADSKAALVLADPGSELPASGATVLTITPDSAADGLGGVFSSGLRADNLAYVIYTSGSTGRPKGVQIPHRALVNLLRSMIRETGLTHADRWLAVTSLSFDIAGLEVFAPLLVGAELRVLADDAAHATALVSEVRRATIAQATPSAWRMLVDAGLGEEPGIRAVCGGEALPADLAEQLAVRMGSVWNAYGPTETTIWSCLQPVRPGEAVTIGTPLANTQVYVLDETLRPVPIGVPGELYIGGDGVARGYRDRTDLTAARFVADPFGRTGGRLFRTGDTVRRRPDGRIDFIGRSDYQVKIRGFRIELGEIESVLRTHPSVGQVVVVPRPDGLGGHQLVAHLVGAAGTGAETGAATPQELRAHVAAHVPDYMVPSAYMWLDAYPLTPNGKIDRAALPDPDRGATAAGEIVELSTDTQRLVAKLWAEELGVDRIGADDTFRDLGGYSIAALRVVLRVKEATGHEVPLASLLTGATVATIAAAIDSGTEEQASVLVPLNGSPASDERPLFLIHPLGGTVFCYGSLSDSLPADLPTFGIQAYDHLGPDGPRPATIEDIAEHYMRVVRAVQPEGPYRFGGWCMGGAVAYAMARQVEREGGEVEALALIDSSIADPVPPAWVDDDAAAILGAFADKLPITLAELQRIPSERRLQHALSLAEGHLARPDVGSVDDLRRLVQLYQRHAKALLDYRDQDHVPYRGSAVVIRGEEAPHTRPDLGWGAKVAGPLVVLETPGDHRSLLMKENTDDLAERLVVALREGVHALHRFTGAKVAR
ncbi:amino acid adenylation domain-containing protein [Streptomyces sp. NBC_00536]|uniref:non-ribosomal peptide synthetase n=1 Tax=Streptomyces sp. NBC_00536 TaxID=2975769 RepID=UPI002E821C95|nr:amino acid adenylation domain-containing protein [Streptomyces sp. NBC_00536]WUC79614.1 amino acid adenylation domain-containing protein [Streptomyces sp. NBC_00536]